MTKSSIHNHNDQDNKRPIANFEMRMKIAFFQSRKDKMRMWILFFQSLAWRREQEFLFFHLVLWDKNKNQDSDNSRKNFCLSLDWHFPKKTVILPNFLENLRQEIDFFQSRALRWEREFLLSPVSRREREIENSFSWSKKK